MKKFKKKELAWTQAKLTQERDLIALVKSLNKEIQEKSVCIDVQDTQDKKRSQ
jgi:hypothetical protein